MSRRILVAGGLTLLGLWGAPALAAEPLQQARLEQRLGARVPLELAFRDETGRDARLGEYFGRRPVVLVFTYFGCSQLCTDVLQGLDRSLRALPPSADCEVLTVSIDPADTPAGAAWRKHMLPGAKRPGWHFLTGSKPAIRALTEACGFHYAYERTTHQFAHPAGTLVLTPAGRLSRYFYGIEPPADALSAALATASGEHVGRPVAEQLLRCFHDIFASGRYGPLIDTVIKLAGSLTVLGVAGLIGRSLWRERRARPGG